MGGIQRFLKLHASVCLSLLFLFLFFHGSPAAADAAAAADASAEDQSSRTIVLEADCSSGLPSDRQLCRGIIDSLASYFTDIHWLPVEDQQTGSHARRMHITVSDRKITETEQKTAAAFTAELSFFREEELLWEETVVLGGAGESLPEAVQQAVLHASRAIPPLILEIPGLLTGDRIERVENNRVWLYLQASAPAAGGEYFTAADSRGDETALFRVESLAYWDALTADEKERAADRINTDSYFPEPVDDPWHAVVPAEVVYTREPLKAGMSVYPGERTSGVRLSADVSYVFQRGGRVSFTAAPGWSRRAVSLRVGLSAGYAEYNAASYTIPVFWAAGTAGLQLTVKPRLDVRENPSRFFGFFSRGELLAGMEAGLGYAEQRFQPETVKKGMVLAADFFLAVRYAVNSRLHLGIEGGAFFLMDIPDNDYSTLNDLVDTGFIRIGPSVTFLL